MSPGNDSVWLEKVYCTFVTQEAKDKLDHCKLLSCIQCRMDMMGFRIDFATKKLLLGVLSFNSFHNVPYKYHTTSNSKFRA